METTNTDQNEEFTTAEERLNTLGRAYAKKYPNSPDPLDNISDFGPDGLLGLLEGANGREIKFFYSGQGSDQIDFEYV